MTELDFKTYPALSSFGGINTGDAPFNIGDGESSDEFNLSSEKHPAISQRKDAIKVFENEDFEKIMFLGKIFSGKPFCIAIKNGKAGLFYFEDVWKEITASKDILTELENAEEFKAVNFSEKKTVLTLGKGAHMVCIDENFKASFVEKKGQEPLPEDVTFALVKNERLLTGSRHNVNFAVSGYQEMSWVNADDIEIFYVRTEEGKGCTGLSCFSDIAIYFKENSTHILYGKTPDSYYLDVLSHSVGCIADKSIAETSAGLLWLSKDGVYIYNATTRPYKVSHKIKKYIDNMTDASDSCGGSDGACYYLSLKQKDGENVLLVYDTEKKIWHVWGNPGYKDFVNIEGFLYARNDTEIFRLNDKGNTGEWHFTTKPFDVGGASRQSNIFKIFLNLSAKEGSKLEVYISGDAEGDNFTKLYKNSFGGETYEKAEIKIKPGVHVRNLKCFRLKFTGQGECTIHGFEVYMRVRGRTY